ncbi:hypothetical protein HN51_009998 [Arachis hypogaea]|nr:interactor of constitutive active ROPs 3 [Arachis duranensis]XP_015952354.1 interactor of constitutive active ROPs 3 [Arachis duranensis]XP_015952355.1 interactor of constitutive active ROPs 3 [Arachis duranensis]XP_052114317.1 interactor of constitutive active ROPs 3 [Arachis duranensis]QHO54992.1 Interactor of constitutive active ROPs [Arachis hypogaea]QHO54993.1 Interactor of constitutive active ROPs [Arachis hypogaea]
MQTPNPKTRNGGSSEVPQKVSPRAMRQLRPTGLDTDAVSSLSQANKMSKERSPKIADRRSPRSPVPERKRPSKISELESQVSQLQEDLRVVRDQLILSESSKKQAKQEAEDVKDQLLVLSAKLEDSQKQILELSATKELHDSELEKTIEEHECELEASRNRLSVDPAALASAMNEMQHLKAQLGLTANCETEQIQHIESADTELLSLKQNLSETLSLVEEMKNQLRNCKESEAQAQAMVNETLLQLEEANRTVDQLRTDAAKAVDGYNSIALELDESRARINSLEELASNHSGNSLIEGLKESEDPTPIEGEIHALKAEVARLRSAVETAETNYQEEQIRSTVQLRNAYELMEQIKSESNKKACDLEAELKAKKVEIEELKANLMDKETELQGIVEENENLSSKLDESIASKKENKLKQELNKLNECVAGLKADLMDKETTLQSISEENESLKSEINKSLSDGGKVSKEEAAAEVEAAKAAEREALAKLGIVMEEADRSNRKAARVAEQLEAAQAASSEMEAELRRLKVQSDQWRKAAEAAAAMLSAGNNGKITERTVSLDSNNYKRSPFGEHMMDDDDEYNRKKNGNMLKKIGVLWKKPQK